MIRTRYSICIFLFAVFISALMAGCDYQMVSREAPAINTIKKNSRFTIRLPEDHRTGNLWQLHPDFDKHIVANLNTVWHGNEKGIDFHFQAVNVGETTLKLVLRSYKDTLDVKSYLVKITEN